jgi:trehalose 6-phosphate phosphatase
MDVASKSVRNRAGERDQPDRGQGGRHRGALAEAGGKDEQRDDHDSPADPEQCAEEPGGKPDGNEAHTRIVRAVAAVERLSEAPELAAILLDIDGTLAPIAPRPEDARVPDEARAEVATLAERYALVACISGRTGEDARRMVGVEGVRYVGAHGLELAPDADRWRNEIHAFASGVDWPVEDKGLTVSFHYRQAEDEDAALEYLEEVAEKARRSGLIPRFGRKVLEIRPPVRADKGTAVRQLLDEAGLHRALYAGDDSTDADAFRALDKLEVGVRVAVSSDEAPSDLVESADIVVASPAELLTLLARL